MKTRLIIFLFIPFILLSQKKENYNRISELTTLKTPPVYSDELKLKFTLLEILKEYGNNFIYAENIRQSLYLIERAKSGDFSLKIINLENIVIDILHFEKVIKNNDTYFALTSKDIKRTTKENIKLKLFNQTNNSVQLIDYPNMLWDKEIMNISPDLNLGKILNRSIALSYVVYDDKEETPSPIFRICTDGAFLRYENGGKAKLLTVDKYNNVVKYGDRDGFLSGIFTYGTYGKGDNMLDNPTGIAFGKRDTLGTTLIYPVYIADQHNERVIRINFHIKQEGNCDYDVESFTVLKDSLYGPYSISIYGTDIEDDNNQKIWVSEINPAHPTISVLSMDGTLLHRIQGYLYNNVYYEFLPNTQLFLSTYGYGFPALVFTDTERNFIITCPLETSGIGTLTKGSDDEYFIEAADLYQMPADNVINSIHIMKTSEQTALWPYVWVTTGWSFPQGSTVSQVHGFKMNKSWGLQYLGSSDQPRNTSYVFNDLFNIIMVNGTYDLFTIEKWTDSKGIRKFYPFAGIHSDNLTNYCDDSTDYLTWNGRFTNECWVALSAERKIGPDAWEEVKITQIIGDIIQPSSEPIFYTLAGQMNPTIRIKMKLDIKDYAIGGRIRLHARLYPEYFDYNNLNQYVDYVPKDYEVDITRRCLPKPGGCPFLYVKDVDSNYIVDNNILHKAEYTMSVGDITDKYILRVKPLIENGYVYTALAENEHDVTNLDFVKIYAIDHPEGTKVFITEDNQVAMFYETNVQSTDTANKNGDNITSKIQYGNNNFFVQGIINDSIYAHYPSGLLLTKSKNNFNRKRNYNDNSDNVSNRKNTKSDNSGINDSSNAVIIELKNSDTANPVTYKNWAGQIDANTSVGSQVSRLFSRREFSSRIIIPIPITLTTETGYIDYLNIDWSSDYAVNYISVAKSVEYNSGFTSNEIILDNAVSYTLSGSEDVTSSLANTDQTYATLDSARVLKLKFDATGLAEPKSGYIRDYMIECVGNYTASGDKLMVKKDNEIPFEFKLFQNYPNPFNPTSKIKFSLPRNLKVVIKVYDILGREVKTLINEFRTAGNYEVLFDGTNFASGVYFYRIEAGSFVDAKKMVLVK